MKKSNKFYKNKTTKNTQANSLLRLTLLFILFFGLFLFWIEARENDRCTPVYSLMQPGLFNKDSSALAPFFLPFEDIYAHYATQPTSKMQANITDWWERICRGAKAKDISSLIYQTNNTTLKLLRTALQSKSTSLPQQLRNNSFARYLRKNRCTETIDYLLYAKACEPYLIASDAWSEGGKDTNAMQQLIEEGQRAFAKCISDYLRLRYLYQLMRLAHYMGDPQQALELYNSMFLSILLPEVMVGQDYSVIYFWIQELRAGALQATGQRSEAARLFAFCFLNRPECRASSFASFRLLNDEEWNQALALCENDEERATLYAMRAQKPNSRALEEMQAIYALQKCPDYLEVLLLKEVKELEKQLLSRFYPYRKKLLKKRFSTRKMHPDVAQYLINLRNFTHDVGKSPMALHPTLWKTAEAYLLLLAGNYYQAQKLLEELKPQVHHQTALAQQIEVLSAFATISTFDAALLPPPSNELARTQAIAQIETQAYQLLLTNSTLTDNPISRQRNALRAYLLDQMAKFYRDLKHPGLEFRCLYPNSLHLKLNPQTPIIEDLLAVLDSTKSRETRQDSLLFRFRNALTRDTSGQNLEALLYNLQGIMALQHLQLPRAIEYLQRVPPALRDQFGVAAPFIFTIVDSSHIQRQLDSIDLYNRYTFAQKLHNLRYEIEANIEDPSALYFQMGLGLYNTTYFGHAWILRDEFRDPHNWTRLKRDSLYSYPKAPYGNIEVMNIDLPLYYFKKAILYAKINERPNLAAQAAYMAAKCEQIQFFQSKAFPGIPKGNTIPYVPDEYRTYFEMLRTEFYDTDFYDYVQNECLYFHNYIIRKDTSN